MSDKITLTKLERLLLINQLTIIDGMTKTTDHAQQIELLENGYEIFYDDILSSVFDPMAADKSRFVLDVLDMYGALHHFKEEHPTEAAQLEKEHHRLHFPGFDGNTETKEMAFAHFLLKTQGKFGEQLPYEKKTDRWNSHMPVTDLYRARLRVWHELGEPFDLTLDQVRAILNAR